MVPGLAGLGALLLLLPITAGTILPLAGLARPLLGGTELGRAAETLGRTMLDTGLYSGGAAVVAVSIGFLAASCVGRGRQLTLVSLSAAIVLLSLPPALAALGTARLAAAAPAWADPILRSRFTVCIVLGLRFFPVALLLGLRALRAMPPSWAFAAALHGVPLGIYLRRVVLPRVRRDVFASLLIVALLAASDLGTVHVLRPAGHDSLPLAIFTVMANAPERLVASLCTASSALAAAGLVALGLISRKREAP